MIPSIRTLNLCLFLGASSMIGVALYMQHQMDLNPCYLCIVQRVFVILTGLLALLAVLHNPANKGQKRYAGAIGLSALAGAGFSLRQLWLQSLPEEKVPACGPPADYLFDALPIAEALPMLLSGDGNCAEVQWTFLSLSIPAWTLLAFATMALLGGYQLLRKSP
ncbi:MAG: disulfide bond formation protein B [Gammaproteobacteria bacterium]|nr:disulfide bond formation protein B [Gammaproteobacteria bacterium]MBQ0839117.1 disulfide bond formation protein B [Gammaproteobacteria bacterium]